MEIVIEFSVAMFLDAADTDLLSVDSNINQVLSGEIEFLHAGDWTTFNDALAEWLLQVLPEDVLPEHVLGVSVVTEEKPRKYGRDPTRIRTTPSLTRYWRIHTLPYSRSKPSMASLGSA